MGWKGKIERIDENRVRIPKDYQSENLKRHGVSMRVAGLVYADDEMLGSILSDESLEQVANVATLPGIVGSSIAMPDIHHGYGFAIGGVAAFDASSGIISPGGVGYDINCGVRLLSSGLMVEEVKPHVERLINTMFSNVPCGVGSEGKLRLSAKEIDQVLAEGARWAVRSGYGWEDDLDAMEEGGCIEGGDPDVVSPNAKKRGSGQLGTLGAGNHFLEIQKVDKIYDPAVAAAFGIHEPGQVMVMIHTGSRGCGHQICTDYLEEMRRANRKYGIPLVDRELACAPASSDEAQKYFAAMKGGANFAWANRQLITHWVRQSFESVLGRPATDLGLSMVYDVAHNMAKLEKHTFEGKERWLYVHRKGATRSFGPGHPEVSDKYRSVGQPVMIPGDMGTASYVLVGTQRAMDESFGSCCHGAGRTMSRHAARKKHTADSVIKMLADKGIYLQAMSKRVIAEEAPDAYKDVDRVVEVTHRAGIARKVARMEPIGVVKG